MKVSGVHHLRHISMIMVMCVLVDCAPRGNDWQNIDYSSVYRRAKGYENDSSYTPPRSVLGCVDEDLYNCK